MIEMIIVISRPPNEHFIECAYSNKSITNQRYIEMAETYLKEMQERDSVVT